MTTNHEKYLAGEPLTPELKALKEGRAPETTPPWENPHGAQRSGPAADVRRPLTRAEKTALREMRASPGWEVLQKLLERSTLLRTEAATKLSQDDPLANRDQIALAWAHLKMLSQAHRDINDQVQAELEKAESGETSSTEL